MKVDMTIGDISLQIKSIRLNTALSSASTYVGGGSSVFENDSGAAITGTQSRSKEKILAVRDDRSMTLRTSTTTKREFFRPPTKPVGSAFGSSAVGFMASVPVD
jgi:hypothetical protein